jgi:type III secretory pathway component EscS
MKLLGYHAAATMLQEKTLPYTLQAIVFLPPSQGHMA